MPQSPQPPDGQNDLVELSEDEEGKNGIPSSTVQSEFETDDVMDSEDTSDIRENPKVKVTDLPKANLRNNQGNGRSNNGSADIEIIELDDEGSEIKHEHLMIPVDKNGVSDEDEDDLDDEAGALSLDEDAEDGVNPSVNSSLMATEVLDNSVDSNEDGEDEDDEDEGEVSDGRKPQQKRPVLDDEVMEIVEEDPLLGHEDAGSGLEDEDLDETVLSDGDDEESQDDQDQERINNSRSPIPIANTSELDNSGDSSVEEVMDNSGGDSCEEILDDDDESGAIVVNDSKSLAQLAASSTMASNNINSTIININTPPSAKKEQSKEPTLVIIDTNSILSGKGPIPIQKPTITSTMSSNNSLQQHTINSNSNSPKSNSAASTKSDILLAPSKGGATINIPDDAFLIEAPSFIVPYVFEQTGQKVLKTYVKEIAEEIKKEKAAANGDAEVEDPPPKKKSEDYFESPVGKLLINLGMSLVQEYVQVDLLKLQRRKAEKERLKSRSGVPNMQTQQSIISLKNNIEESKENNEPFRYPLHKCKNCNFKTESELVLSTHLETPHMKNNCYRCNFCKHTTKLPNEILLHMEQDHKILRPKLERAPAVHQCPHCAFEDNSKAKLTRHLVSCTKRFRMDKNLEPPLDWDTPGKLPKMPKNRLVQQGAYGAAYGANAQQQSQRSLLVQYPTMSSMANKYLQHQQGNRMQLPPLLQAPKAKPLPGLIRTNPGMLNPINKINQQGLPRGMIMRTASGQQVLTQPQIVGGQVIHQVIGNQLQMAGNSNSSKFLSTLGMGSGASNAAQRSASQLVSRNNQGKNSQPSISITPLPRQSSVPAPAIASHSKPQGKASFVICEICDGYIKDLDQLRNHMQWIHKVKIHPKMIYNKPPLNCQKCQFRFFTDQGLERHLLGSHGLVTSSMQEAANKGQDNGRCPLCGKVYQWKLLAHVAKDHNVTLKPAHLSYKCTVCTATFGMYKLFESHVYSAHSMNSKRTNANNNSGRPNPSGSSNNMNNNRGGQMQVTTRTVPSGGSGAAGSNPFKPLKINDEITIIPQPLANATPLRTKGSLTITPHTANNAPRRAGRSNGDDGIEIIEIEETSNGRKENGEYRPLTSSSALRKRNLDISVCGTDSDNSDDSYQRGPLPAKRLRGN